LSCLANSCEYLTSEKLCLAVSDSEKAKASRQVRCKNEEKMTCCYLCMFVLDCATPCRFLGNPENDSLPIEVEKTETQSTFINNNKIEEDKTKNVLFPCCSLCNVEMSQTRTKFRIDRWEEAHHKLANDDSRKSNEKILSVVVYLCPKCGKIDLKADED
jgi:hypothetical protein